MPAEPALKASDTPKTMLKWFPLYTAPRSEKKVFRRIVELKYEAYLPLVKTLHQWSDRKKWVEVPMFSSYVFVRIDFRDHHKVLQVPGAVRFIYFSGEAASVPDHQVEWLVRINENRFRVEVTQQKFDKGQDVEITEGPFKGLIGEMVSRKGQHLFLVRINGINYNLLLEIEQNKLRKHPKAVQHEKENAGYSESRR
jgi:transcriptional antiterminator RfaH